MDQVIDTPNVPPFSLLLLFETLLFDEDTGKSLCFRGTKRDLKPDLCDSKLQTTPVTLKARNRKWGVEKRRKRATDMEGANRAEGNRGIHPHLHIFLSRVWRKRIREYVNKAPEHNHTAWEAP